MIQEEIDTLLFDVPQEPAQLMLVLYLQQELQFEHQTHPYF
jgi:hypothetical protein